MQLADLGKEVRYIEVEHTKVPYDFLIRLEDQTFLFTIRYNESGEFFTVDLATASGRSLAFGDIVRYGRPLFGSVEDERFPLPVIIPQCLSGDDISEVTYENFGREVKLYLHERRVDV